MGNILESFQIPRSVSSLFAQLIERQAPRGEGVWGYPFYMANHFLEDRTLASEDPTGILIGQCSGRPAPASAEGCIDQPDSLNSVDSFLLRHVARF
jgi:hypothetical protein